MNLLLVDDSRVMRQLVRRTLRQAGYAPTQVVECENGQEALDKIDTVKPDLVLSDWNMPIMTGIDMLSNLRARGNKTPVGFITSESTPAMKARAQGTGALFVLTKPFDAGNLRDVMSAAGVRPNAPLGAMTAVTPQASVVMKFGEKGVAKILQELINAPVQVVPGPKVVTAAGPVVSMTWADDQDVLRYAGVCELALAGILGAVMSVRPPAVVAEILRTKKLDPAMQPDSREVFNVLSRGFNDANSVHVRLQSITFPPAPILPACATLDRAPGSRLDYTVTVQGYGSGKLSLLSTNPGEFILQPKP
jgi:two-component system chemotaxis response regulator CheY